MTQNESPRRFVPDWSLACLLAIVAVVNFLCMPNDFMPGDPVAMREETRSMLEGRGLHIDPELVKLFGEPGQYVVHNENTGLHYSKYGFMCSVMYLVPMIAERLSEGTLGPLMTAPRVMWLNWYNWALSLLLAFLLYRLAMRFTERRGLATGFVLLTYYATFLWNYLRVQNSEIFQIFFYVAFASAALLCFRNWGGRAPRARYLSLVWVWAWALCLALTKVSYILMGPCFVAAFAYFLIERKEASGWVEGLRRSVTQNFVPGLAVLATVLGLNWVRFGSPFLTGYHQWRPEIHAPSGDPTDSLFGLLFSAQWSVFFHFPLIALGLWGWRRVWGKDRAWSALVLGVSAVYVVLIGLLPSWRGEMCYGPRYFLFLLVVLSVPAVCAMEELGALWSRNLRAKLGVGFVAAMLAWSAFLQFEVIRYPFFAFYQARDPVGQGLQVNLSIFFVNTHYGRVNWDLVRWLDDPATLPFMKEAQKAYPPDAWNGYREHLKRVYARRNFYWIERPQL